MVYNAHDTERERERETPRETLCRVVSWTDRYRADLSILITKTSEKKAEKKKVVQERERERDGTSLSILFYTPPLDERDQKKDEETRKQSKKKSRRVDTSGCRKHFFARQRGAPLERDLSRSVDEG